MGPQVIALRGIADSGKTTTIGLAYQTLAQGAEFVLNLRPRDTKETTAILEIDGVKVGFTSLGDRPIIVETRLSRLIAESCMVIVCAAHTRGGTVETVELLAGEADPPFTVEWIDKIKEHADYDEVNREMASEIVTKVREAVDSLAVPA